MKDSEYFEYRVTTDVDLPVRSLCDVIYEWASLGLNHDMLKARRLLEDTGDARVVYDQVQPPGPVAPRDFAFTLKRQRGRDGSCRLDVVLSNERAPPLREGWVRLSKLTARWQVDPRPRGAHVTYWLFSDPGGAVPAAFVHGSQRDAALDTVKKALRLARDSAARAGSR